ncbi:MAG: hypothetical protein IJI25_08775 [Eubacterium sp.]|nr:hypothetical protein [Eubacterium sp.]
MAPPTPPPQPQQTNPIQNQVPDANNTPVAPDPLGQLQGMSDAQLAQLYTQSQNAQLPNHLNDVNDQTQKFVYTIGMNDKPLVLDQAAFNQFMQDNNIPQSQILSRSINKGTLTTTAKNTSTITPQDIVDMIKYSRLNYIGGKIGGQAYGAGTYLDMNGGGNTFYGGTTMTGVLNPNTAKVITDTRLGVLAKAFDKSHPQFAKATGGYSTTFRNNNMSIYATILGYNVIKENGGTYHNVIDRKALVLLK